jgi:diadenosine tetraphosphatase ApaH/serine/threonine PP2A family protein phosphatase
MRALVISDIHANLQALEAVLAAAPAHDVVWNLGDVVGYGANPNEAIDGVRALGGLLVRGNHDRACSGLMGIEDFSENAARAVRWTRKVLSEKRRQWLRELAAGPVTPEGSAEVSCVHGSPLDEDEYLFSVNDAWASLREAAARITFFGHTHVQGGFASNGEEFFHLQPDLSGSDEAEEGELLLRAGARYLLNPGSVGQPRDGDWRAAFALYDSARSLLVWLRVPYQVTETQKRIRAAGLPEHLADRLSVGR